MTDQERSQLLSKFEKIKSRTSDTFMFTQWVEFDAFCLGYNLAKKE